MTLHRLLKNLSHFCGIRHPRHLFVAAIAALAAPFALREMTPSTSASETILSWPDVGDHLEMAPELNKVPPSISKNKLTPPESIDESAPSPVSSDHIAIYDISAHTVYLPSGQTLEAHSGLGRHLDDPRFVSEKHRGPTPPNSYDLFLRNGFFHRVRAIRLIPVGSEKMFGRDGLLAHSYMLGRSGQSNGCVAIRDYPAFLTAFLSGEIRRLVVVDQLTSETNLQTASGLARATNSASF